MSSKSNAQLTAELKEATERVAALEKENDELKAKIAMFNGSNPESGFVVIVPNARFSEIVLGVKFYNGRAYIPDREEARDIINQFKDWGYDVYNLEEDDIPDLKPIDVESPSMLSRLEQMAPMS